MKLADRVGPTLIDKSGIGVPNLGAEQGIVSPTVRCIDIQIGRHDVEVTRQNDRHIVLQ